jgi:hypothetical protein
MYLDVSLPVAICHATGIDGGEANVQEAKSGLDERMYLDVSLPVAVRHATGIDGGAANVPEPQDRAGGQDQHFQLLGTLQKVNHLQKKLFQTLLYSSGGSPALKLTIPGFPHKCLLVSCGDIGFVKKIPRCSIDLEIRPQSAFSAFRALPPSANYTAG